MLADLIALALFAIGSLIIGVGFGLAVPALNVLAVGSRPRTADQGVLLLNAMLGVGTALAPVLLALFSGLGIWWACHCRSLPH